MYSESQRAGNDTWGRDCAGLGHRREITTHTDRDPFALPHTHTNSGNSLGPDGATTLATPLAHLTGLQHLDLGWVALSSITPH
jgi:hypothetical protein